MEGGVFFATPVNSPNHRQPPSLSVTRCLASGQVRYLLSELYAGRGDRLLRGTIPFPSGDLRSQQLLVMGNAGLHGGCADRTRE
jgi:hypothetical protein